MTPALLSVDHMICRRTGFSSIKAEKNSKNKLAWLCIPPQGTAVFDFVWKELHSSLGVFHVDNSAK
jgi:hypothetical protein